MKQETLAPRLDVKSFAQSASELSGQDLLSNYERLMHETAGLGGERPLNWSVQGELTTDETGAVQWWLHVLASVSLPLTCQRCLGPVDSLVAFERSFRFVETEEAAETQDEESEEDVLAINPEFRLSDLIEDEILMELPLVPRHAECPTDVKLVAEDAGFEQASSEKRHPFAVLSKLQGGSSEQ